MKLLTREALLSFRRAPLLSALSITTIAFSLFTIGLFGLVAINLREALRGLEERVEIVAFVLRGTPAETITLATQDIAAFPEVQDVTYVTEEQALARARRELVEFRDAYRDLQVNPLPASIEVRLKEGYRDATNVERVAQRLRGFSFVEDVRFDRLGVFTYSPEEGTPSPAYAGQVPAEVAAERAARVQEAQDAIAWERAAKLVGSVADVLVDGPSEDGAFDWEGRTAGQAPEIDGVVYLRGRRDFTPGRFARVRIAEVEGYELVGERA